MRNIDFLYFNCLIFQKSTLSFLIALSLSSSIHNASRGDIEKGLRQASQDVTSLRQIEGNSSNELVDDTDRDFLLDYTTEALSLIYSLTSGQPYLIQLIGFQLVRNYNDQVFEQNSSRDSIFTVEDVEATINHSFFQQGRYYFEGVWGQASQGAPAQHNIIKALAPHPQGISKDELISNTGLDQEKLNSGITTLKRHDVIKEQDGYRIIVELFRRWVIMSQQIAIATG